ncbi:MAG: PAS sensor protein, partial [Methylococcaceae bacterium]
LEAKILAVADLVEAMASHRPYRAALGMKAALSEITAQRGITLDAPSVDACLRIFNEHGYQFDD